MAFDPLQGIFLPSVGLVIRNCAKDAEEASLELLSGRKPYEFLHDVYDTFAVQQVDNRSLHEVDVGQVIGFHCGVIV
jgi:hypothetical protein